MPSPRLSIILLFLFCTLVVHAQELRRVSGTVKDENGESIGGATVRSTTTTRSTMTDADGRFQWETGPGDEVITVSSVGFITQEIHLGGKTEVNVVLPEDRKLLAELVVVGYGVMRKKDLTGSLTSIASQKMKDNPVANLGEALQGRAAGVQIVNTGAPGSNVSIRIRGLGSVNNSDPLLVIDGVPTDMPLNALNHNDVESVDVLKDASATAIYGSRGANGVVLITTKKGKPGDGVISLATNWGFQNPTRVPDMLNARQFASLHNEMMAANGEAQRPDFADPSAFTQSTDWADALLRTGVMKNYTVSYSGGTDKSNYYVSGGYLDQEGTVIQTAYKRYTLQFNNEARNRSWLKFGNHLTFSHDVKNQGNYHVLNSLASLPTQPVFNDDGTYSGPGAEAKFYGDLRNPIGTANLETNEARGYNVLGNLYGEVSITDKLLFRSTGGIDFKFWDNVSFSPKYDWKPIPVPSSQRSESSHKSITYLWDNTLTYMDVINGKHSINAMAGSSAQNNVFSFMNASIKDFLSDDFNQLNNGLIDPTVGGSRSEWALLSYFGRLNYAYENKYLMTATVRRDGTSRISSAHRWGTFPSFSAAWRISEEDFFTENSWIDDLKLRVGYGVTGNQAVLDNYAAFTRLRTSQYVFNGQAVSTLYPLVMPNPDIRWETVRQGNVGVDASLFQNRLNVTLDAYLKTTRDMLVRMVVPITTGYSDIYTPMINAGEVRNRGWELSLRSDNLRGPLEWTSDLNISYNKNEVVKLNNSVPIYYGYQHHREGLPIGSFYGHLTNGLFQNVEEVQNYAYQYQGDDPANSTAPGDIRFLDINNDGVVNDYDRTYIGNPTPAWSFALTNNLRYKNFDLQFFLQGVAGNEIFNANRITLEGMYTVRNQTTEVLARWTGEGTSNTVPRAIYSDPNKNTRASDRFVEDGSYLRLKNLTLGYTVPASILGKLGNPRLYLSAQNLLTFTRYSGFDPEVQGGVDQSIYPMSKTISFGLDVRF